MFSLFRRCSRVADSTALLSKYALECLLVSFGKGLPVPTFLYQYQGTKHSHRSQYLERQKWYTCMDESYNWCRHLQASFKIVNMGVQCIDCYHGDKHPVTLCPWKFSILPTILQNYIHVSERDNNDENIENVFLPGDRQRSLVFSNLADIKFNSP